MTSRRVALLAAALLGVAISQPSWPSQQHPVEVRSSIAKCSRASIELAMTLKNLGREPIKLYKASLPWGIKSSLVMVVATNAPDPEIVSPALYFDDPGPGTITFQPSETATGKIDLQHRFPTLWQALEKRDLVVFWSYQMPLVDGGLTSRVGGSLLLSKESCKDLKRSTSALRD